MKIDEACINQNAVRLIEELASTAYECTGEDRKDFVLCTLGEICGVLDLARTLKEILKGKAG